MRMVVNKVAIYAVAGAAVLTLFGVAPASAGSGGQSANTTTLKSSSGGTGLSKSGGNGGTGIPTTANAPLGRLQSTFRPAHVTAPPPAGVRPHTDLAAAQKLTDLSSRGITKESSLYNKIVLGPRDPNLAGPYAAHIGPASGGSASFKQTPGFTAEESKGNVYVTNGGTDNNTRPTASLSSRGVASAATFAAFETDEPVRRGGYGLVDWLFALIAVIASGAIAVWLRQAAPKSARMAF